MSTEATPDAVLASLLARPDMRPKRRAGLEALHRICRAQSETSKDFSRATMGRLCEAAGIAHKRMLYNGCASEYLELLAAWEAAYGKRRDVSQPSTKFQDWSDRIEDPSLRQLVQRLKKDRDVAVAELNLLKSAVAVSVHWTVSRPSAQDAPLQIIETTAVQLTASERDALTDAISQSVLKREGWQAGAHGEVSTAQGRLIFRPGFIAAVKKVLANAKR